MDIARWKWPENPSAPQERVNIPILSASLQMKGYVSKQGRVSEYTFCKKVEATENEIKTKKTVTVMTMFLR